MERESAPSVPPEKLRRREAKIPSLAKRATDAARERSLRSGLAVIVVQGDRLVRLSPDGETKRVGSVAGKTSREIGTYTLEWTPRPRD